MKFLFAAALATLIASAASADTPLVAIEDLTRGATVSVAGTVERITDEDEFRLSDATGTVRVYIGPNRMPADVGEAVTVEGVVDDDLGPLEIYARSLTRADGTVVTFDLRYE
jgi:uncharacterized protein YdeI (BOF family)